MNCRRQSAPRAGANSFRTCGKALILLGLAIAGTCASAMPPHEAVDPVAEPRFESIGGHAIARDVVASLAQDKTGFLWIGTGDGLVRFDGYRFRTLERNTTTLSQRSLGWIRKMLPGADGRLWIGTEAAGLDMYDPVTEEVTGHGSHGVPRAGGPHPAIRALAQGPDGSVWVGNPAGLSRFDPGQGRFTEHYAAGTSSADLPDSRVQALLVDHDGALWVGTWRGLSRLAPDGQAFQQIAASSAQGQFDLATRTVQAIVQTSNGRIWLGTEEGDLLTVEPDRRVARLVLRGVQDEDGLRGAVTSLVQVTPEQLWVGRVTGIDVHDIESGALLRQLRHDPRRPAGLAGNEVSSLLLDQAGWVWVGGFGLGLQRHNPDPLGIRVRGTDLAPDSPLSSPDVRTLLELDNGEVWAATHTRGVAVLDQRLNVVTTLSIPSPQARPGGSAPLPTALQVTAMTQAQDRKVWLGTRDALWQLSPERRLLQRIAAAAGPPRKLLADGDGTLWVGATDGLHYLEPQAQHLVRVGLDSGAPLQGEVTALVRGPDQALWVGAAAGLYRIAPGSRQAEAVQFTPGGGLANPIVIGFLVDAGGTLWLDTSGGGLHRMTAWDGRQATFDRVSERHGIVNKPFGSNLMLDRRGRIWTHMHLYDPATDKLDELTTADGITFGTGWFYSYAALRDGRMLIGGSKGLLVIEPDRFDTSTYAPPLVLAELRINGVREPVDPALTRMQIGPDQRSFALEFAALDFAAPERLRYAYRLSGFDDDWIETGPSFRAPSYSRLSPGRYEFQVRATNRSGRWSSRPLRVLLVVTPAWWQHWAFWLACLLGLALVFQALLRYRTHQLDAQRRELEDIVKDRTRELEEASLTDALTGLHNRRFVTQHIDVDLALAIRNSEEHPRAVLVADGVDLCFFLIDLDHFKQVNDRHGHDAGDAVLQQMRDRLRLVFRDSDYLVRWGGEEFLAVARQSSRAHAANLAERVRRAVCDRPFVLPDGTEMSRTCSVGFACFPLSHRFPRALDWHGIVKIADAALYAVKEQGRNGWMGLIEVDAELPETLSAVVAGGPQAWAESPSATMRRS